NENVARSVIVKEEENLILLDRAPEIAAELMVVITGPDRRGMTRSQGEAAVQVVDGIARVETAVAEKLKCRAVEAIAAGFGYDVGYGASSAAEFGGIAVSIDLELLHGVLAELVRCAPRTGAAERLAKEGVVVVGAVNGQRVERPALPAEAEVAATDVLNHCRGEQHEIHEIAAVYW